MVRKSDLVSGMAEQAARSIAQDAASWKKYLDMASRLYKYSFDDQLLIYAQRPDAEACASMELWNNKMRRWVKGGSKGIALIRHKEGGKPYLDYVFDVADTRPVQGARMPYLWRMGEEHQPAVLKALEGKYGRCGSQDMGKCLMEAVSRAVRAAAPGYLRDFSYDRGHSQRNGENSEAAVAHFTEVLCASVQYAVLTRCGMKAADHLEDKELAWVTAFSEPASMHHLGNAVSAVAMEILQEIGRTIREQDRKMAEKLRDFQADREKQETEKHKKTLENIGQAVYSGVTGKFNDLKCESKERSREDGSTGVQGMRGIPDSGSGSGREEGDGGNAVREIWDAETKLPDGTPQGDVHFHAADRKAPASSAGDRQAGPGAGRPDRGGDDGEGHRGRGFEGEGSDGLGAGGKQLHSAGGRDGAAGDRVQLRQETGAGRGLEGREEKEALFGQQEPGAAGKLHMEQRDAAGQDSAASASVLSPGPEETKMPGTEEDTGMETGQHSLFPTVEGQIKRIAMAQEAEQAGMNRAHSVPMFLGVPEDVVNAAFTCGGSKVNSTQRIMAFYQKSPEDAEAAAFLEKEYGIWGRGIRVSGKEYAFWHDGKGIRIAPGRRADIPGSTLVSWNEAARLIRQLLREGKYASQDRLDAAWGNECLELAQKMWYMRHDISDEARKRGFLPYLSKLCGGGFSESTERIAGALQEEEGKTALAAELGEFAQAYETDRELMRFRIFNPVRVMKAFSGLGTRLEQFEAAEGFEAVKEGFITEDEADSILTTGIKAADKKLEIYSCFMQGHKQGKCAAFLRKTYQDANAGSRHGRCRVSYGNKGMEIAAEDGFSGHGGNDTLRLDWKEVERRVRGLINEGRYLSPEELAYTSEYEKRQLARQVYGFYFHDPNAPRKGERIWDAEAAERDYLPMLDDPKYKVILYQDMVETFAAVPDGDEGSYKPMKAAVEAMGAFIRGEYSLFAPLPESVPGKGNADHDQAKRAQGERSLKRTAERAGTDKGTEGEKAKKPAAGRQRKGKPAGELETAARALAGKQKQDTKEEKDGQLSFDFGSFGVPHMEPQPDGLPGAGGTGRGKEAGGMPERNQEPDEPGSLTGREPETIVDPADVKVPDTTGSDKGSVADAAAAPDPDQTPHSATAAKPETEQEEKPTVTLYRETLAELVETVRHSSLYPYLRDRDTAYDEAAVELEDTLGHFLDSIEGNRPELYDAFRTLPKFREWMAEDILERTYQDMAADTRDAVARHEGEPDTPEWAQEKKQKTGREQQAADADPHIENDTVITKTQETAESATPDHADLEEAKQLIDAFCHDEYGAGPMDFSNLEHLGIAWTAIEDEQHEISVMAEVDLLNPSISKYVDDACVERREYGSLRELIDKELCALDCVELLRLDNVDPETLLEAGIPEERLPEVTGTVQWESGAAQEGEAAAAPREAVEIEGGQIMTAGSVTVYSNGLPYDIAAQKLHSGSERHNFRITDEALGTGGPKAKFQGNLAAIRTLKQIEAGNRMATPEEQETLSRYVGWGGIAQAFDPGNEKWEKEYAALKGALTPEEYASARGSVLNAHYTCPVVIGAIYEALGRMDFTPGNILEPSCGIGNFFGLLPEEYGSSRLYGVELDSLTGRIAGQLYQRADITVDGFEHTQFPDDFFDLAIGNVPFGEYKIHDRRYDRQNLLIHDYFLTKALDKVRPGGIMVFVTTKGTMDKAGSSAREGLAQKADLLGAIRLPNNAFLGNAGTSVTADILFFQKRGSVPEKLPDWVCTGQTVSGIPLNNYFLQHPEMILGKMEFTSNMYGSDKETACLPFPGNSLKDMLAEAVGRIVQPDRELLQMDAPGQQEQTEGEIPADPDVRNFSFTEKGGRFYFRENSRMKPVELKGLPAARARGMIAIRDSARRLIDLQLGGAGDADVGKGQAELNSLYDAFREKYGLLNSPGNRQVFRNDSSYPLLSSLEVLDGEGNFKRKADMFSKRTICHRSPVSSVDTAVEALGVSIGERACVDLGFMASLMGGSEKIPQIVSDLRGIIFKDPDTGPFDPELRDDTWYKGWQAADEYLSGNVRQKLERARAAAEKHPEFSVNVEALENVQPKDLSAAEISVRIGAPWIDTKYYRQFLAELLQVKAGRRRGNIDVMYSEATGEWRVKRDSAAVSSTDTRVWNTYGTKRMSAYEIFENTLNQRSIQIFDYRTNEEGKDIRVLNEKQTAIAQQKQEAIREAFQNWIFKDPERRSDLCGIYNRLFNSIRPREYDGRHIVFSGMNPEKKLEAHQRNAVARILYGKNTLLAHVVGAGKTYEMAAAAMEAKRLGLCRKSMFVVPNHLTEQWGSEFLALYPGAKVLVATRKDFEPKNRKRFCARIATGDFDAVIIGHSQFERIPLSRGRQEATIQAQIDEIVDAIAEAKVEKSERFTIKQMERMKKSLEAKMQKLHDKKKDDTVTFEELGIDRLFVDEAHYYKNLFLNTKMRNVAGISQTAAQKSSDMFDKCRYMDETTGGRGIVFATGTPISNSMVELYTMMRYLQYDMLEEGLQDSSGMTRSLKHFDNWAATFGEQVTAVELKPEGTGFRLKTRFARFYNLPELMNCWKEVADIQTAEMLKLPVPKAEYITIQTESSEAQKGMMQDLAVRAEKIRRERVDPTIDNMLKVTSDGRKLALDQRLMNPLLPDDPGSKVNACAGEVFRIWQETADKRGTQLVFLDLSTPRGKAGTKNDAPDKGQSADLEGIQPGRGCIVVQENLVPPGESGPSPDLLAEEAMEFSVYEDIRRKLVAKGIPEDEVVFIHSANTETQKAELFAKVWDGRVRVLLGSTQKMGAGTNVQKRLAAIHNLDCPWRPADLEQRGGRGIRRGNDNGLVQIFNYVTKGTFDAYIWGLVEAKQKFIGQVMTGKSPVRSIEDVDATALSYAEVKMLATGDIRIKEKMDLDIQVSKLKMLKSNHLSQQYELQDRVRGYYPNKIKETLLYIDCLEADLPILEAHPAKENAFSMTVMGTVYKDRREAGKAIVAACRLIDEPEKEIELGEYRGFPMKAVFTASKFKVTMKQHLTYTAELSDDIGGNIARINNALERIPQSLEIHREELARLQGEMENAKEEMDKPFPQEQELEEKSARLAELNSVLDHEEKDGGEEQEEEQEAQKSQEKQGGKPSILKTLKEYEPPAPANSGAGRKKEREAVG